MQGLRVHITGIVQGVGFRPFVYKLATRLDLKGRVRNTSAGVDIEVDGEENVLNSFVQALRDEAPPLSHIDELTASCGPTNGFSVHSTFSALKPSPPPSNPSRQTLPSVTIVCVKSSTRMIGVIAIPSSTAPIADHASPSSKTFLMTVPRRPWRVLPYVLNVNANIQIPGTGDSMHSL